MNLEKLDGWIWVDGEFTPWQNARIHVLTHTLHYGSGVFEGVRSYPTQNGGVAIFRLNCHTKRLLNSCRILNIKVPFSLEQLNEAQLNVLRKNQLSRAYIRPLVFLGAEELGLHAKNLSTRVIVAASSWGSYFGDDTLKDGIAVGISSYSRLVSSSSLLKAKACGNYLNSYLAAREASQNGFHEALLLDKEGYVAEGSAQNFFIIRNGKIYTPDTAAILEGITRDSVFHIAKNLGIPIYEKRITRDEVYVADEAFFSGTATEILPIKSVDHRQIGAGHIGPITQMIQTTFFDIVSGRDAKYQEWLSFI